MRWSKASNLLKRVCRRDDEADDDAVVLSRRDALAGIGLAGVCVLVPQLLASGAAEAKPGDRPAVDAGAPSPDATQAEVAERGSAEDNAPDSATELSSRHRRYWRRRYWRRRYWGRRYRRRYWPHVYRRRRYWRRRYYVRRRVYW